MVGKHRVSVAYQHARTFDMRALWRLAVWGASAAVALRRRGRRLFGASSRRFMAADDGSEGRHAAQQSAVHPRPTRKLTRAQRLAAASMAGGRRRAADGADRRDRTQPRGRHRLIKRQGVEAGGAAVRDPARTGDDRERRGASSHCGDQELAKEQPKDAAKEVRCRRAGTAECPAARQPTAAPRRNRHRLRRSPIFQ